MNGRAKRKSEQNHQRREFSEQEKLAENEKGSGRSKVQDSDPLLYTQLMPILAYSQKLCSRKFLPTLSQ